jgi:hypothetical protein
MKGVLEGRPSETVKELLDEHGDPDKMTPMVLSTLCGAYETLKDYNKLFACLDSVQEKNRFRRT